MVLQMSLNCNSHLPQLGIGEKSNLNVNLANFHFLKQYANQCSHPLKYTGLLILQCRFPTSFVKDAGSCGSAISGGPQVLPLRHYGEGSASVGSHRQISLSSIPLLNAFSYKSVPCSFHIILQIHTQISLAKIGIPKGEEDQIEADSKPAGSSYN